MPTTKSSHLISVEVLTEAVQGAFAGMKALWGSPAVIVRTDMPSMTIEGGKIVKGETIKIPYFGSLGEMEDIVNEGDALTPSLLTMSDETTTVQHSGKAYEITKFARVFASGGSDPYAEAARQMRELVERRADKAMLDAATAGIQAAYVNDVWSNGAPVTINWDLMVESKLLWGDEQGDISLITVHSKVYGDLLKLKDSTGRPLLVDMQNGDIPRFMGIPIKVSDRNTIIDPGAGQKLKYVTHIYKRGALIFWMNGSPTIAEDRDILADTDVLAMHIYWAAHRYKRVAGGTHPGVIEIIHN